MKVIIQILMLVSTISLVFSALYWLNILEGDFLNVSGQGFMWASIACSVYAIALQVTKPFGGGGGAGE